MKGISEDAWERVERAHPLAENLVAGMAVPSQTDRLLLGCDSKGRRHLLVRLDDGEMDFFHTDLRGLAVSTRELSLNGAGNDRYIDLLCETPAGHPMLDVLGGEIAVKLAMKECVPSDVVSDVIAKWRHFWMRSGEHLLAREQQLGLFAELWFLLNWLMPTVGIAEALRRWRGPHGARHDFECQGLSVECKGTTSMRGRIFTCHGLEQMANPTGGRLLVFCMRMREEAGSENTLADIVDECSKQTRDDVQATLLLEAALVAAGFRQADADEYRRSRWRITESCLFAVEADFPRILPESFTAGIPGGIEAIDYTVNLNTFDRLIIARTPEEAIPALHARTG